MMVFVGFISIIFLTIIGISGIIVIFDSVIQKIKRKEEKAEKIREQAEDEQFDTSDMVNSTLLYSDNIDRLRQGCLLVFTTYASFNNADLQKQGTRGMRQHISLEDSLSKFSKLLNAKLHESEITYTRYKELVNRLDNAVITKLATIARTLTVFPYEDYISLSSKVEAVLREVDVERLKHCKLILSELTTRYNEVETLILEFEKLLFKLANSFESKNSDESLLSDLEAMTGQLNQY